jgi:hypothetical protein
MRTPIRQGIGLSLEIGSLLYQNGRHVRVASFLSEFQKRRDLARNVLPTCHRISPLGYLPPRKYAAARESFQQKSGSLLKS